MYELDPDSAAELDQICEDQPRKGEALRKCVERLCADPSGRLEPRHGYSKKFHNANRYVDVADGDTVWEFIPNQWRGLFITAEEHVGEETHRLLIFVSIRGKRFLTMSEAPWHR